MNQTEFAYWVQGMVEYTDIDKLDISELRAKLKGIKEHLKLVFNKQTSDPKNVEVSSKDKNLIEPSEALRKLFEKNQEDLRKGRKPGDLTPSKEWVDGKSPSFAPTSYDVDKWLTHTPIRDVGISTQYKLPLSPVC